VELAVLAFFFGLSAGTIGKIKGSSFFIWFLIGLVLPGLGTLAALLYCGRDLDWPDPESTAANTPV
jgi:hypothetical protein